MIRENAIKIGQNCIAPQIFSANTVMILPIAERPGGDN